MNNLQESFSAVEAAYFNMASVITQIVQVTERSGGNEHIKYEEILKILKQFGVKLNVVEE